MYGEVPIEIPVPTAGWNVSQPRHRLSPQQLFDGRNMLVGLDGILSPRRGYDHLGPQPAQGLTDDLRLVAGIWFTDTAGGQQAVVASLRQWWALQSSVWVSIASGLGSDKDTASRFVVFGSVNNKSALYGVNGHIHDELRRWLVGDLLSTTLPGVSLAADDLDVIAERLVMVNVAEASSP